MAHDGIMRGFPPPPEHQVTLANWREAGFNGWAFHHVREVLPTANVSRGDGAVRELTYQPIDCDAVAFEDSQGGETTVGQFFADSATDGVVVLHEGRVIFERYDNGMTPETPHILFSVTKSVAATLTGIVADQGRLDPDGPITDYVPEVAGSAYGDATVRHLLDMTVGIRFVEDYEDLTGDFARYRMATGWMPGQETTEGLRKFLPTLQKTGEHGDAFHYVSPNTDLLGWVLERATDMPFAELLSREIWRPMGAERDAYIALDPYGAPRAAGGLCVTLRDLARFGQMHLEHGLANGHRIVPAWWLADLRENGDPAAWAKGGYESMPDWRYRSKWYIAPDGAYCGLGIHGQTVFVDPAANLVAAKFSSQPSALDEALDATTAKAWHAIAEALNG